MAKKWKVIIGIFVGLVIVGMVTGEDKPEEKEEVIDKKVSAEEKENKVEAGDKEDAKVELKKDKADKERKKKEEEKAKKLLSEEEYESSIGELTGDMSEYMAKFSEVNLEMSENPMLLYNDDWVYEVAGIIAGMSATLDKMNELDAPKKFKGMDKYLKEAIKEFKFVTDNYPKAIDNMDVDMLMKCVDKLNAGNELIEKAYEEYLKLDN